MLDLTKPIPDGVYPDLVLSKPTHVQGGPGAVFNSISVGAGASGSIIEGVSVALTPTTKTNGNSSVVMINGASGVVVRGVAIRAGLAVAGVPETFTPPIPDAYGSNVLGWPTARGITVQYARDVTIEDCEISDAYRGVVALFSPGVTIARNQIHGLRGTPISAAGCDDLTLADNWLHDSKPWGWGNGAADHGDFIHVWTDKSHAPGPTQNLQILRNLIDQGQGVAMLGISIQDTAGVGFVGTVLDGNIILNGNNQGYRLENVQGVLSNAVMLQTSGGPKDAPSIILAGGANNPMSNCRVAISNILGADSAHALLGNASCTVLPASVRSALELQLARRLVGR